MVARYGGHRIVCYDAPCIHFSKVNQKFTWYCACGASKVATGQSDTSTEELRKHMNTCTGAVPDSKAAAE